MAGDHNLVRRWLGRIARLAGSLFTVLLVLLAHTTPARRAVLRRAIDTLEDRRDLVLKADGLTYNLLDLRVTLTGVTIAAAHTRHTPFLAADSIEVALPASVLLGRMSVDRIRVENGRLTIRRLADGSSNLPADRAASEPREPSALPIGRIDVPRLSVTFRDERGDASLDLPAMSVDVRPETGRIGLDRPGRLRRGGLATEISNLGGGVTFDGRVVALDAFALTTSEAAFVLGGTIALLARDPRMELRFSGGGDVPGLARWGTDQPVPSGRVTVDGALTGPLSSPTAAVRIRSESLTYRSWALSRVNLALTVNSRQLDASGFEAALAGGRVAGDATLAFESGEMALNASWSDLSLDALFGALVPRGAIRPAGRATGSANTARCRIGSHAVDARRAHARQRHARTSPPHHDWHDRPSGRGRPLAARRRSRARRNDHPCGAAREHRWPEFRSVEPWRHDRARQPECAWSRRYASHGSAAGSAPECDRRGKSPRGSQVVGLAGAAALPDRGI